MKSFLPRRNRSGITLLEMVVVVAVVSLLATVTVRLLHAMLRQQTATTTQLSLANSMHRMAQQLRKDVHSASEVDIYLNGTLVIAIPDEENIEWKHSDNRLVRTATIAGKPRTESFDLLPELEHSFEKQTIDGTEFIALELQHKTAAESADTSARDSRFVTVARGGRILASVGRDLRYLEEQEQ